MTRIRQMSFIPERFARVGKELRLRGSSGEWTSGWKVLLAGRLIHEPPDVHRAIRGHRRATGDALPRMIK